MPTTDVNLFINFFGVINYQTTGKLAQYLQAYSRPLQKRGVGLIQVKKIYLLINSQGGILQLGNSIYEIVKTSFNDIPIITYNLGIVDSSAVAIFCMGQERYALPNSRFIIHEAVAEVKGELKRVKEAVESTDDATKKLISILSETCQKPSRTIKRDISRHKYLSAEKAKEYGLIDEIKDKLPRPAQNDEVVLVV